MRKIEASGRFKRRLDKLSATEQQQIVDAVRRMQADLSHPSLQASKLGGHKGIWYSRASTNLRITFELVGDTIILRNCGDHDPTLDRP